MRLCRTPLSDEALGDDGANIVDQGFWEQKGRNMYSKTLFVCLIAIFLAACAASSAKKLNKVSVGMTKAEVISVMGPPISTAARNGVEYLNYRLATSFFDTDGSDTYMYFVRLVNGRVDAYGRKGDFGTTTTPEKRIQIEVK